MPQPSFYISKVIISNFRGIKSLTLDLHQDRPVLLIGPNNSGKSTVLDAVGICLRSAKASKFVPSDGDYWRPGSSASAEAFAIEVHFCAAAGGALPAVKGGVGDPIDVHAVKAVATRDNEAVTRRLLDAKGEVILLLKSTPVSKGKQEDYKGFGLTGRQYARLDDIRDWLPDIWQLEAKSVYPSLYEWKSGPLQRLLRLYKEDLLSTQWMTQSGRPMPDALVQIERFLTSQALPTPYWRDTIAPKMREKFKAYLGGQPSFDISPQLASIDQWIFGQLMLMIVPAAGLSAVDSKKLGDGWQSLLRMAALELVVDLGDSKRALILMEEPETYLHPHLRRRFRRVFARLQAEGYQCIVTTHSPELLSFSEAQDITRLTMTVDGVSKQTYATAADQALRDEEKLHERGNHEVAFSSCAILVEGKDDEYAIRLGLEKKSIDCDALSISVVDCGSVGNLPSYAGLCQALGIPWIAVHDGDVLADGTRKGTTGIARTKLDALLTTTSLIVEWDNDLEEVLQCSTGKASPRWTNQQYGAKSWAELSAMGDLAKYCPTIDAIELHLKAVGLVS